MPKDIAIIADTGLLGIGKQHGNILMPKKKPRGGALSDTEKAMNRLISGTRIAVEHAIGGMKRFHTVSDIYRNKNGWDDQLVTVAAGLWNFHLRMT